MQRQLFQTLHGKVSFICSHETVACHIKQELQGDKCYNAVSLRLSQIDVC